MTWPQILACWVELDQEQREKAALLTSAVHAAVLSANGAVKAGALKEFLQDLMKDTSKRKNRAGPDPIQQAKKAGIPIEEQ